jgi:hypothetical protein
MKFVFWRLQTDIPEILIILLWRNKVNSIINPSYFQENFQKILTDIMNTADGVGKGALFMDVTFVSNLSANNVFYEIFQGQP